MCKACHGTGIIVYRKMVNDLLYEYAAKCRCDRGQQQSIEIPFITEIPQEYDNNADTKPFYYES